MKPQIRVAVGDARDLIRQWMVDELEGAPLLTVVGEANSARRALELAEASEPDVFVISPYLPGEEPDRLIRTISAKKKAKVIILGSLLSRKMVFDLLKAGAAGYISEDSPRRNLAKAVRAVNRGEMWVPRKMMAAFFQSLLRSHPQDQVLNAADNRGLSLREREVLCCLHKGYCNKDIADELCISEKTVKTHLGNIFKKLNINQRFQAVMYTLEQNLG